MNGQLRMERGFITEFLTDDEIHDLDNAVKLYSTGSFDEICVSDCMVADLSQSLWKQIWKYRDHYSACCERGEL